MGARRMTRETPCETRCLKRALVDRPAHPLSEHLRCAVEALARPGDDRLAPWQRASERAQIRTGTMGEAQDRAAAARLQIGDRSEKLGADRDREFGRSGWRRRAHV